MTIADTLVGVLMRNTQCNIVVVVSVALDVAVEVIIIITFIALKRALLVS